MARPDTRLPAREFWTQVRHRFTGRYLEFHEEPSVPVPGRRATAALPSLVGPWAGRLWEVRFLEPRVLSPDMQVGMTTASRLADPDQMPHEPMPWVYAGARPGVFTRSSIGTDRILARYRRTRKSVKGSGTGDPELDRRWAVYAFDEALDPVFRTPEVTEVLRGAAGLAPSIGRDLPTFAVYGTEATLTLPTDATTGRVGRVLTSFEGFGRFLDRLEEQRGLPAASTEAIPMDLRRDDTGAPFPLARFPCPWCRATVHARYEPNIDTEVCEQCQKPLYQAR